MTPFIVKDLSQQAQGYQALKRRENRDYTWVSIKYSTFNDDFVFCSAVQNAETCLAQIPAECLQSAITNRIHHIGVCTLEYSGE